MNTLNNIRSWRNGWDEETPMPISVEGIDYIFDLVDRMREKLKHCISTEPNPAITIQALLDETEK